LIIAKGLICARARSGSRWRKIRSGFLL